MKRKTISLFLLLFLLLSGVFSSCDSEKSAEQAFIQDNTDFAVAQTREMLKLTGAPNSKNYPRTTNQKGELRTTGMRDWTPGFFPGSLWYLYELTGDNFWKQEAEQWTSTLEPNQYFTGNHDIGFMMYCSYGNAERLAPHPEYQKILIQSAESAITRFDERVQAIESWDYRRAWNGEEWFYPVIIDNMMNLELLFYASRVTGDKKYYDIAVAHADKTMKYHLRPDGSSYHVVDYDTTSGLPLHQQTCQGYSDNSTWSRGQAWAIYGFTMMYRETKNKTYLETARRCVDCFMRNLPEDLVPLWDFNVDQDGFTPDGKSYAVLHKDKVKDASAAAIACSALFELGELSGEQQYTNTAIRILKSLASPEYRAQLGENAGFIIMHCTGSFPHHSEIDSPLVYADYYFLEALLRYKKLLAA